MPDLTADRAARRRWLRGAVAAHLGLALLVFSPMVLRGKLAVWSTDNYYTHLPNLLFAHDVVRAGDPGLWNPYVQCGMDFSASALNGVYYPMNWPLFLLPRDWVVAGWGVRGLIELWLVGVFAYLLFREELQDARWALFSSIMYQMGGYALWCMTVWGGGLLFMTAGLYVVWSLPRRPRWRSMAYLAACGAMLMIGTILPYAFAGMAAICLFYVYRYWPDSINPLSRRGYKGTFLAGIAAAVLLGMFRLLPVALSLPEGNRMSAGADPRRFLVPPSTVYMGVSAFAPEAMGVHFSSSTPMMAHAVEGFTRHSHPFAFPYHGALAVLLGLWAAVACRDRRVLFWLAVVAISSAYLLSVRPVADLIRMLVYPTYHPSVPKPIVAIGLCALAGHAGHRLARQAGGVTSAQIAWTAALAAGGVCFLVLFRAYQDPDVMRSARAWILLAGLWTGVGVLAGVRSPRLLRWFVVLTVVAVASGAAWAVWRHGADVADMQRTSPLFGLVAVNILASLLGMGWCLLAAAVWRRRSGTGWAVVAATAAVVGAVAVIACLSGVAVPPLADSARPIVAAMGIARFALAAVVFVTVVLLARRRETVRAALFPLLVAMLLVDLIPFNKIYSHMVTQPFGLYAELYPDTGHRLRFGERRILSGNLLANSAFEMDGDPPPAAWRKGSNRAGGPMLEVRRADGGGNEDSRIVALAHDSPETAHLFQTVRTAAPARDRTFACGAWARTSSPDTVSLLLTDSLSGAASASHSGSGRWEWLSASHTGTSPEVWVRMHISMSQPGRAEVCGAALVEGHYVLPTVRPPGAEPPDGPAYEDLDLANYRVNQPHQVLGLYSHELQTNRPTVYGLRSYGGVDAMIPRRHMAMILHFVPDAFQRGGGRGGIAPNLTQPRLLDLFGCRYDLAVQAGRVRKEALSRLMLFEGYEVIAEDAEALDRLESPEFDPNRRLVLSSAPSVPSAAAPSRAIPLDYTSPTTSRIEVSVRAARPSLVLFNDSYHKGWGAEVNGRAVEVLRANYNFMAVAVPPGQSNVVFRFRPRRLFLGLKVSAIGAALLLAAGCLGYVRDRKDRPHRDEGQDSGSRVP